MVLLGLQSSGGVTGLGLQDAHTHVWWLMLAVTWEFNEGYWLEATYASPYGLGFSQHANWILRDRVALRMRVNIPEGKKQKLPALTSRPGLQLIE